MCVPALDGPFCPLGWRGARWTGISEEPRLRLNTHTCLRAPQHTHAPCGDRPQSLRLRRGLGRLAPGDTGPRDRVRTRGQRPRQWPHRPQDPWAPCGGASSPLRLPFHRRPSRPQARAGAVPPDSRQCPCPLTGSSTSQASASLSRPPPPSPGWPRARARLVRPAVPRVPRHASDGGQASASPWGRADGAERTRA